MTFTLWLCVTVPLIVEAFFFGRAYQAASQQPQVRPFPPEPEKVDGWLAHFREYRAAHREESLQVAYTAWRAHFGFHAAVADYVAQMGVYDPAYGSLTRAQ